jgi:DNA-binding GntR family transcriptional regulator
MNAMEKAYQYLYESILSGKIPLGAPIFEVDTANTLSISRSPVREALKRLEAEGLVDSYAGRGAFVIQITREDLDEIFELRLILELASLKKAAKNISMEFWNNIEKAVMALDEDVPREKYYEVDYRLHHTIIHCCGNKRLELFYRRLETQIDIVRRISARDPVHFTHSKEYHLKIIRAMLENDLDSAIKHLEEHINDVRDNTIKVYLYGMGMAIDF